MKISSALLFLTCILLTSCSGAPSVNNSKNTVPTKKKAEQQSTHSDLQKNLKTLISKKEKLKLSKYCYDELKKLPGKVHNKEALLNACQKAEQLDQCNSVKGLPIFHYNKPGTDAQNKGKRILTIALIHGDERPSGTMARSWISRLETIDSRNDWRVIPIANPDGKKLNTRTNANKVDLNRNFPTSNWDKSAVNYWKKRKKSDPRKYPGPEPASEIETKCLVQHIKDFDPDFIISIHTPYGLLDFDGPKSMKFPHFKPLPWISLGNYPGSLGRYMWVNNKVPVLTIELKGPLGVKSLEQFDRLQDISGTVAIQSTRSLKKKAIKDL